MWTRGFRREAAHQDLAHVFAAEGGPVMSKVLIMILGAGATGKTTLSRAFAGKDRKKRGIWREFLLPAGAERDHEPGNKPGSNLLQSNGTSAEQPL